MVYDLLILAALWMLTGALSLAVTGGTMDVQHPPWWQRTALLAVTAGYFVLSWVRGGQTIGMRAWRLRVGTLDGATLGPGRALLRWFLASLSLACAGAGFWWALVDPQRQTVHDRLARTRVRKLAR